MRIASVICLLAAAQTTVPAQSRVGIEIVRVANSADYQPGLPQPGSRASIFIRRLDGGREGVRHGRMRVSIGSIPAPILAIETRGADEVIQVQVPWEATGSSLDVEVSEGEVSSRTTAPQVGSTLFFVSVFFADPDGYAVVQHAADHSMVTKDNPAHAGESLIAYGINLGPVSHQPADGAPAPVNPAAISIAAAPVCSFTANIRWGGMNTVPLAESPVRSMELAPRSVGVYQVTFQVPQSLPVGDVAMSLTRQLIENEIGCPGIPSGDQILTQQSRTVLVPVR